jgi:hypothetical protein
MKKRVTGNVTIRVSLVPGRCRWCGCTYDTPCANGCGWADRARTLCTECVPLDKAMQTAKGRRELAEFVQEYAPTGPTVFGLFATRGSSVVPRATSQTSRTSKSLRHG